MRNNKTVVVLSRYWPTGLSVIRSLGEAGFIVDYVASSPKKDEYRIAAASCFVRNAVESVCKSVKRSDDPELLDNLLEYGKEVNSDEDRLVLFPTDDYTVSFMERHRAELETIFVMPYIEGGSIIESMDKLVQGELARKAGLRTPKEWLVSLSAELEIPEDMSYPCFCKPLESISGFKGEMKKCEDEQALAAHLRFLKDRNPDRSILVQEFLNIDNEIDLSGVCIGGEVIIPAIIRKTAIAEHEKGVTMAGYLAPYEELGDFGQGVIEMMRLSGYNGMFDLEINVVGDELYFGEINFRSGGPNYAYFLGGVNLPAIFVNRLLGQTVESSECCVKEFGKHFLYEKVAYKEYLDGYLSKAELNKIIDAADNLLIGSSEDTKPTQLFKAELEAKEKAKNKKALKAGIKSAIYPAIKRSMEIIGGYPQLRRGGHEKTRGTALVVGRNYCSNLCMARSLGQAGYDVKILRIFNHKPKRSDIMAHIIPEAYSKYVSGFYTVVQAGKSRRVAEAMLTLAKEIENASTKTDRREGVLTPTDNKMIVFPTEDVAAYIIDEYYDELSAYYLLPNIGSKQGEIVRMMSKDRQKELAREAGVPCAASCLVRIAGGSYELPEDIEYPCFIKPDVSRLSGKGRMKKCEDKESLRADLDEIATSRDMDVVVERYLDIKRELAVLGISTPGRASCEGCFEISDGGNGARRGVSITGRLIEMSELGELREQLETFMKGLNYTGLFDIDLVEEQDGRISFIELNLRYGASGYVLTESGMNLPAAMAKYMQSGELTEIESSGNKKLERIAPGTADDNSGEQAIAEYRAGTSFVSEKVLIEEFAEGLVDEQYVSTVMASVDVHFIMNEQDEKPYRHFEKFYSRLAQDEKKH